MNRTSKWNVIALILVVLCCGDLFAQESSEEKKSALAIRQRMVERKMVELEARFTAAAERIREKDPGAAERLIKTYQKSKEQSLSKKMASVSELLDEGSYNEAASELDEVIGTLESMIRLLTDEKEKEVSKADEIDALEKAKNAAEEALEKQRKQTAENDKVGNKEESLANLEAQIKQLQGLIKKQEDNIEKTEANMDSGMRKLDGLADEQFKIRKDTEALAKAIRGQQSPKEGQPPSDGTGVKPPAEGQLGDGETPPPGENKPSEKKPGEEKPGESKPGESKPERE